MTCVSDGCMGACVALHGPGCSSGPLDDADIPCAFGDFCLDGACVPQYEQGHACDADWQCVWGLVCVDGVCSSGALSGQRCDPQHICARGLFCQTDGICYQPTLGAAVGESCGATTFCTSGAWCDWSSTKCVERILEGDKCNSSSECLIGFSCTGEPEQMVCTKRRAVAQPCAKPLDCFSGICTDGLCASIDVNSCQ